jgi:hypothetical protein
METTERIVEAYVRHVKGWATIPNIRCDGQNEIDLLAVDPVSKSFYHIEVSISISQSFRKLTGKPYDREAAKERVQKAKQRRTVGFFVDQKFDAPTVTDRLKDFGFEPGAYHRVIVTWGWDDDAERQANDANIELWDFRDLIAQIADEIRGERTYFADDTLRTLNLFIHASDSENRTSAGRSSAPREHPERQSEGAGSAETFWVYDNRVHNYAAVHHGSCTHCQEGRGTHGAGATPNSQWLGPFGRLGDAMKRAEQTGRRHVRRCGTCSPTQKA